MRTVCLAIAFSAVSAPLAAQWLQVPLPGTPRTADGKPNLSAAAPRSADGRPDLSGIWLRIKSMDRGDVPMQPWARAVYDERQANRSKDDPEGLCLPPGIPEQMVNPMPWKIIQTPGEIVILFEQWANYRQIFTDGRSLPDISKPSWFGYSIGRWDGDTFVAETAGFNDRTWLGNDGHPHTEAMRVTERFRRIDFGHMEVQFTFDDPKAFTRPWSATAQLQLLPDTEVMEYICENQKWTPPR
jgi:hypothetical protein